MFIWMTRSGSKLRIIRKSARVILTHTIRTVDAVLDIAVATIFCTAGSVGMGRGVGVVGGGPESEGRRDVTVHQFI